MKKRKKKVTPYRKAVKFWKMYLKNTGLDKHNPDRYIEKDGKLIHRQIMEIVLQRALTEQEVVHHKNKNILDCHPDNLELCVDQKDHLSKHHSKHFDVELTRKLRKLGKNPNVSRKKAAAYLNISESLVKKMIRMYSIKWTASDEHDLTESSVQHLLKENSTAEVANILGVHVQTLRNKFPKIFQTSNKTPGFLEPYKEEILSLKKQGLSNAKIGEKFDTNKNTIWRYLQKWSGKLPNKGSSAKPQGFLDVHQKEIEELLLSGFSQLQTAQKFETSRTTLAVAIRRWSRQGVLDPAVASLLNANPHLKQKL